MITTATGRHGRRVCADRRCVSTTSAISAGAAPAVLSCELREVMSLRAMRLCAEGCSCDMTIPTFAWKVFGHCLLCIKFHGMRSSVRIYIMRILACLRTPNSKKLPKSHHRKALKTQCTYFLQVHAGCNVRYINATKDSRADLSTGPKPGLLGGSTQASNMQSTPN